MRMILTYYYRREVEGPGRRSVTQMTKIYYSVCHFRLAFPFVSILVLQLNLLMCMILNCVLIFVKVVYDVFASRLLRV